MGDLERFVRAQDTGNSYGRALGELRAGRKTGHWMWFIFPQAAGLGHSETARRYAIASLAEARAYLDHPVLGARLLECAQVVRELQSRRAEDIFGQVDAKKLHSSMTLFMRARSEEPVFEEVVRTFFDGRPDTRTDTWLAVHP